MFLGPGDVTVMDKTMVGSVFKVVTHVGFLVDFIVFLYWKRYYGAVIALSTLLISGMYHICEAGWYCFGFDVAAQSNAPGYPFSNYSASPIPPTFSMGALIAMRVWDHINSQHAIGAIILSAALSEGGGGPHVVLYRTLLVFVAVFGVLSFPFQIQSVYVIIAYLTLVIAFDYLVVREGRLPRPDRFHLTAIVVALALGLVGVLLYFFNFGIPDEIAHSLWHTLMSIVLPIVVFAVSKNRPTWCGGADATLE
jgi:hypothetical protein